jgi:hypothetical protein
LSLEDLTPGAEVSVTREIEVRLPGEASERTVYS